MPRVWLTYCNDTGEYVMFDKKPEGRTHGDSVVVDMNASLHRQIRAAEAKYWKFQELLEGFYADGELSDDENSNVRRVR